ncbi:MAG: NYN domain-containing protein [Acidobacteria bacterium]|nr:NYN domain-containing protein [Acidobacteriota bacterium]
MERSPEVTTLAVFCDFENVALGVRDAKFSRFDVNKVLERLLLKGNIVVKKAYCDWERYKEFKVALHEASFELIDIPHVRQSGKNSADIRLVVDALDLCYTKAHVDTFVIISGDSDFSPLVSKLRENNKTVIGLGVKNSTADLLIANCDEFIFYDDLAQSDRDTQKRRAKSTRSSKPVPTSQKPVLDPKHQEVFELVEETIEALMSERGAEDKIWGSMIKQTLKRRKPGFSESYYGFRSFSQLLEAVAKHGLIELSYDEKSGGYTIQLVNR